MANREDLPFIFSLLDDPSFIVRQEVESALIAYGPALLKDGAHLMSQMSPLQANALEDILGSMLNQGEKPDWFTWCDIQDDLESLEEAFYQMCRVDFGAQSGEIFFHLESLASQFLRQCPGGDVAALMHFLFEDMAFRPSWSQDPEPLQHTLLHLLRKRNGTNEILTCLALLIGKRAGLKIEALTIQGNLLPADNSGEQIKIFNPANGGHPLSRSVIMYVEESLRRDSPPSELLFSSRNEIILSLLSQSIEHCGIHGRNWEAQRYSEMYEALRIEIHMQDLRNRDSL